MTIRRREFGVPAMHFSESDVTLRKPPALFGQHNEYVYREVLGYSDDQVQKLRDEGHIRERFDDSVINGA
ncbi:MAG: hypothetical protein U5Q44_03505 [Dehalococcoidia bacterium]|nr:hypothetical protein [Dehalococcoidia bacterium]